MCQICIDFRKERLTVEEAFQNLYEIEDSISEEHYDTVLEMLNKALESEANYGNEYDETNLTEGDVYNAVDKDDMDDFWHNDSENWEDLYDPADD